MNCQGSQNNDNKQSYVTLHRGGREAPALQVIKGGKNKPKVVPSQAEKESLAIRWLYHDAKLPTLAWESGLTQSEIARVATAIRYTDGVENGMRAERAKQRLMPPMNSPATAARRAA